ncbi:MAG: hypothetical protein ABJL55_01120 [Roseibium sp.]
MSFYLSGVAIVLVGALSLSTTDSALAGLQQNHPKNEHSNRTSAPFLMAQVPNKLGPTADKQAWAKARKINRCAAYHHYLRTFPNGHSKSAAIEALRTCKPSLHRYQGRSATYFNFYPPYYDPIWPWVVIPEPPVVILPPEENLPPGEIGPEPELPIAPPPDEIDLLPEQPIEPEPDISEPIQLPEFDDNGFDGGGFDGDMDIGGFD